MPTPWPGADEPEPYGLRRRVPAAPAGASTEASAMSKAFTRSRLRTYSPSKCLPYSLTMTSSASLPISKCDCELSIPTFVFVFLCFSSLALFLYQFFSYLLSLAILSPYSSYCACGHSPWVFALPGLILLLPVISFCLLLINASCAAALLSFVLGQRLLLTLSFSLAMSPPRFLLAPFPNLLSSVCLSSFSCLHPDISSDNFRS